MDTIRALFRSKKFIAAITAGVVAGAGFLGLNLSPEQVALVVGPLTAYILGQGIADHGKSAAIIDQEISNAAPPTLAPGPRFDALEQWVRAHAAASGLPVPVVGAPGPGR